MDIILNHEALNKGKLRYKHLCGRAFVHGTTDCYTMLVDMFKDNLNIQLTNYARPNDWWLDEDADLYVKNFKQEGFFALDDPMLEDLRPFDVFLITLPDARAPHKTSTNHCAIYLGEGYIIHHRMGKYSQAIPYRGALRAMTTHVIRHKDVPDLRDLSMKKLDVMQYILPHKREMLMGALNDIKE